MADFVIATDDPGAHDVRKLIETHLAFARSVTPVCRVHALTVDRLVGAGATLFSARRGGELLGVGALQHLDGSHGEIKSMHTTEAARGGGVGRAMVDHLLLVAVERGYQRVSLETGTMDAFAPARALYASAGFESCAPFGDYPPDADSVFMTVTLERLEPDRVQSRGQVPGVGSGIRVVSSNDEATASTIEPDQSSTVQTSP